MGGQLSRLRRSRRREQQAIPSNVTISVSVVAKSTATTNWKVTSSPPSLEVSINGGTYQRVVLKGVCYSPCPLNGSNWYGPNIGDWFWDSFSGITGWEALWKRDFPNIRAPSSTSICANTIRVYSIISNQLGTFPSLGQYFTHTSFLDMCWNDGINPLYVLVGFPMPQLMFWRNDYYDASPAQRNFWENVFVNTVKQVSSHPAVLGFVIQNELDSNLVTWPNEDKSNLQDVEFWWSQVKHFSNVAKTNAPNKLVGMAVHDDPFIPGKAAGYMARCPSIDYWGVNTYQPQSFDTIFNGTPDNPGYAKLTGSALKPVILTEYGFPSTSRPLDTKPEGIYSNSATQNNVAGVLTSMLPKALNTEPLCLGIYIFEYCDEWWSQDEYKIGSGDFKPPNISTWYGGQPAAGFPNGYWDQEGFGIFAIRRGGDLKPDDPIWDESANRPTTPIDLHTSRQPVLQAIHDAYTAD